MSFILDALKKSENERQRQIGPSLADVSVRRARTDRPWWAVAVAGLLLVNLGILLVVLLRNGSPSEGAPTTAPQPATVVAAARSESAPAPQLDEPPRATAMSAPVSGSPAVRSLAEAAAVEPGFAEYEHDYDPSIESAASVPEGPPVVRRIDGPTVAPMAGEPAFAARDRAGNVAPPDEMLPTHASLVAGGTQLPEMRLDIHVYSPNARDRFVFVNMRKYLEGQAISEGPLVERITADGAVMNHNGTRFLLPRQ